MHAQYESVPTLNVSRAFLVINRRIDMTSVEDKTGKRDIENWEEAEELWGTLVCDRVTHGDDPKKVESEDAACMHKMPSWKIIKNYVKNT